MMCQVPPINAGRAHPHEGLVVRDRRLVHLNEPEDICGDGAVGIMNDRRHRRHSEERSGCSYDQGIIDSAAGRGR